MAYMVVFFSVFVLITNLGEGIKLPGLSSPRTNMNLAARPDFFRACTDVKHAILLEKATLDTYNRSACVYVNAVGQILRDSTPIKKAVLAISKCRHSADTSCEVEHWRVGAEICTLMDMKNAMWSPMMNAVHPRAHCPLKKGVYELRNATIDLTKLQAISMELTNYYWRFRVTAFDHELLACIEAGGRLIWRKQI